ncbi:MAG: hypothetical protein FIA96_00645 [Betaproteobacteria bacterium]|nr:hypothetical protein [Betaproteobacteria bacterium]
MVAESPRRPCLSGRVRVNELNGIQKCLAQIFGNPRVPIRCFLHRLCRVSMLITGTLVIQSAAVAEQTDNPERSRVLRMPDTWAVTATEDSIYFDQGSSAIGEDAAELIRRYAAKLRAMPGLQVTLIAHTGDLGSSSLELARGQDRLEAVRKRLEDLKVPLGRIRTENHGSERRNTRACTDDDCLNKSRRVDILLHR